MSPEWFRPRNYKHLDAPVGERFAAHVMNPEFVETHYWLPLIHYIKSEKRYKAKEGRTVYKDRDIMYASHRDACILSKYAHELSEKLDRFYEASELCGQVIAYRKLGKSNYMFSADAYRFAMATAPCMVLCFDITGFFDNLNHAILKERLKRILGETELPDHWYKVFRHVTRYRKVELEDLRAHPVFGPKLKMNAKAPVGTIAEIKAAKIPIYENPKPYGIPQGTPISSPLSNLYMMDVDVHMSAACLARGALYQRYSDDILIVCQPRDKKRLEAELVAQVAAHKLEIKEAKTERVLFTASNPKAFQYLGFHVSPDGTIIRPGSLSRQWRRLKRAIRRAKHANSELALRSDPPVFFTKKLRRKFSPVGARNFSTYARKAAKEFKSDKILKQARRLERTADQAIRDLNK